MLRPYLSRVRPCTGPDPAQFDHMRPDLDPKLLQEHLAHRAAGHPGHRFPGARALQDVARVLARSEEHTSELQSPCNLVCRLLLEKKKKKLNKLSKSVTRSY